MVKNYENGRAAGWAGWLGWLSGLAGLGWLAGKLGRHTAGTPPGEKYEKPVCFLTFWPDSAGTPARGWPPDGYHLSGGVAGQAGCTEAAEEK